MNGERLLTVKNLKVHFPVHSRARWGAKLWLKAIDDVTFHVNQKETVGVVGESGCGKSTLGRTILRLVPATDGYVEFKGREILKLNTRDLRSIRKDLQIIFQDPLASLDPRMTVGDIIAEPLKALYPRMRRVERKRKVGAIMEKVGLLPNQINRYAHEFSGGQAQRIGIARSLVVEPSLVICDEPVSSLDVSIKSQIINLLQDLQHELGLSYVFIAHDLASVRHIANRVVVLYLGRVMEVASRDAIYANPRHPYTQMLMASVPIPDPEIARKRSLEVIRGELPSPLDPPSGCPFRTRCSYATEQCALEKPELRSLGDRLVSCHHSEKLPSFSVA